MKKWNFILLPIVAALSLFSFSSCSTLESSREKLANMSEQEFTDLKTKVRNLAEVGGRRLEEAVHDRRTSNIIMMVSASVANSIEQNNLQYTNILNGLLDEFQQELQNAGISVQHQQYIHDAVTLIDSAVGTISLGLDGELSLRERQLLIALFNGLEAGLAP